MGITTVIYGAGTQGKKLYRFLEKLHLKVDFFCQTYVDGEKELFGVPLASFNNLASIEGEVVFFLAIVDKVVCNQISRRIHSIFLDRAVIIDYNCFMNTDYICDKLGYCNLCNSSINAFVPGGLEGIEQVSLFKEYHIIGGGYREYYSCPVCGGVDRERWQMWVLSNYTDIFSTGCRVLHFAPEEQLSKYILANPECDYYSGDIVLGRAMHKIDIMNIQYKDGLFDYVIMNHVLEHITDMKSAINEVKRVMKDDGKLILSFPICTDQDTLELPNVTSAEDKLKYYGQEDHVRLFGKDYQKIIGDMGLSVSVYIPKNFFSLEDIARYGFIEDDVIMICSKKSVRI